MWARCHRGSAARWRPDNALCSIRCPAEESATSVGENHPFAVERAALGFEGPRQPERQPAPVGFVPRPKAMSPSPLESKRPGLGKDAQDDAHYPKCSPSSPPDYQIFGLTPRRHKRSVRVKSSRVAPNAGSYDAHSRPAIKAARLISSTYRLLAPAATGT